MARSLVEVVTIYPDPFWKICHCQVDHGRYSDQVPWPENSCSWSLPRGRAPDGSWKGTMLLMQMRAYILCKGTRSRTYPWQCFSDRSRCTRWSAANFTMAGEISWAQIRPIFDSWWVEMGKRLGIGCNQHLFVAISENEVSHPWIVPMALG